MADLLNILENGVDVTNVASGAGSSIWNVLIILFWVVLIVGVLWFVFWYNSFKHTIMIRELTSTRKYMVKDKAKIRVNKKDGVEYWFLRGRKVELVSPKPESIEITKKGLFYAECYHDVESGRDAGYSWINDDGKGNFISYPAEHRALLSARIRRASERRGKSTMEMVFTIAAITIPLIAMVLAFSFWGDLTKSTIDAQKSLEVAMKDFSSKVSDYACNQELSLTPPQKTFNGVSSDTPLSEQVLEVSS